MALGKFANEDIDRVKYKLQCGLIGDSVVVNLLVHLADHYLRPK